jgi:hypothetical protein
VEKADEFDDNNFRDKPAESSKERRLWRITAIKMIRLVIMELAMSINL